ncbi:hypothetical protein [Allorhizocola rhizosphaerae]|nr:hypothetical protein [Allorhizocola rhizosphaerae]
MVNTIASIMKLRSRRTVEHGPDFMINPEGGAGVSRVVKVT